MNVKGIAVFKYEFDIKGNCILLLHECFHVVIMTSFPRDKIVREQGEGKRKTVFCAAVDKKLKIVCVSLKASKLLSASRRIVRQGRFLTATLRQFFKRFFSKAERERTMENQVRHHARSSL